jgi:hypothetical protein
MLATNVGVDPVEVVSDDIVDKAVARERLMATETVETETILRRETDEGLTDAVHGVDLLCCCG